MVEGWRAVYLYVTGIANWSSILMATLSDEITGMPFAQVNDRSIINFMQKHGTNVPNKIRSSNNDLLFDIDPDTQLSHTSAKDQFMYYDSNQFISSFGSTTETISMVHANIRFKIQD